MSILLEAVFFVAALALLSRDELFRIAESNDDAFICQLSHDAHAELAVYEFDAGSQFPFLEIRLILAKALAAAAEFLFTKFFTAEFLFAKFLFAKFLTAKFSLTFEVFAGLIVFFFHDTMVLPLCFMDLYADSNP